MTTVPLHTQFPLGERLDDEHFSGAVWVSDLVGFDQPCIVGHVTFEPGCRNSWHVHHGYQMLVCTGGKGWVQYRGASATAMEAGDIVIVPAGVEHWHGAAHDSWFAHLALEPEWQNGPPEWLEPVSDEEYGALG